MLLEEIDAILTTPSETSMDINNYLSSDPKPSRDSLCHSNSLVIETVLCVFCRECFARSFILEPSVAIVGPWYF